MKKTAIRDFLERREMTQREFAGRIGCTVAFASALARGKNTDIKISLFRRIHVLTRIPMKALLDDLLSSKENDEEAEPCRESTTPTS